jgi:SAM-dependent methyltransferase
MAWEDDWVEIADHYRPGVEERRLATLARLEFLRTTEILDRHLPPPPAAIADVGGGPGTYALPLAAAGYAVHLVDPVEEHVRRALARSDDSPHGRLASARSGEARRLPWPEETFDACLFFGPMYHLTAAADRRTALAEAWRVLRPGGLLVATAISRFASTHAGLAWRQLADPAFREIVERDVAEGQHRNPTRNPAWFTTACCHLPDDFAAEIGAAGFHLDALLAVDGPAGCINDLDWWLDDEDRRETLLATVRRVEAEPSLLGASPQLLAVARKDSP